MAVDLVLGCLSGALHLVGALTERVLDLADAVLGRSLGLEVRVSRDLAAELFCLARDLICFTRHVMSS